MFEKLNFGNKNEEEKPSFVEEKEKLAFNLEDANSVLYGIELSNQNLDLAKKMVEIEDEMKKRPYLSKDVNPDTGEMKEGGTTELEGEKAELKKHIKEKLTRPSKYVKGAVISGIIAAGLATDVANQSNLAELFTQNMPDTATLVAELSEMLAVVALTGRSIQQGIKSIQQTIRTKIATNKAFQRMIAMQATGVDEDVSSQIIKRESSTVKEYGRDYVGYKGTEKALAKGYIDLGGGAAIVNQEGVISVEDLQDMRKQLDEMDIPRFDRSKYVDKKKYL